MGVCIVVVAQKAEGNHLRVRRIIAQFRGATSHARLAAGLGALGSEKTFEDFV